MANASFNAPFNQSLFQLWDGPITAESPTLVTMENDAGTRRLDFGGSGLTVSGEDLASGTVAAVTYYVKSGAEWVQKFSVTGGAADASVLQSCISAGDEFSFWFALYAGHDLLQGSAGADNLSSGGGHDTLHGGDGNDTLAGYFGNGYAEPGVSRMYGEAGSDMLQSYGVVGEIVYLDGGSGDDTLGGNQSTDIIFVDSAGDTFSDSIDDLGADEVRASVNVTLAEDCGVDRVRLVGTDAIDGFGNSGNNLLTGNSAANAIRGYGGRDTLEGRDGADHLNGGAGADKLYGGNGTDTLKGGAGSDSFFFDTSLTRVDTIADFNVLDDTIRLDDAQFSLLDAGVLDADAFVIGAAAADAEDRIVYNAATGALLYDADGTGGTEAVRFATLDPGLALTAEDFVVY